MLHNLKSSESTYLQFLHITDCHLLDHGNALFHQQNTRLNLQTVIHQGISSHPGVDFILFTGDISQTGNPASYEVFKSIIDSIHIPIFAVPGNHDNPRLLQQVIANSPDQSISIIPLRHHSLILLNSWVKDEHFGRVSKHCLAQLEQHLKSSDDRFNIFAIHHPPVEVGSPWLDALGLKNAPELLQLINKYSSNSLLLCGHVHQTIDQQLNQLRLLVTPSTCHQFLERTEIMTHDEKSLSAYRHVKIFYNFRIESNVHYLKPDAEIKKAPDMNLGAFN